MSNEWIVKLFFATIVAFIVTTNCYSQDVVTTIAGTTMQGGHADGVGEAARFDKPLAITSDGRYLYIADTWNDTIRRLDPRTHSVITFAGKAGVAGSRDGIGSHARFRYPRGIACDGSNLYVADTGNHSIREIAVATRKVTTIARSTPPRGNGRLDATTVGTKVFVPLSIVAEGGSVYFTDPAFNVVRRLVLNTGMVSVIAGRLGMKGHANGIGSAATFDTPTDLALEGKMLYISDGSNNTVRRLDLRTDQVTTIAGRAGVSGHTNGLSGQVAFDGPTGLYVEDHFLYISDTFNREVRRMNLLAGRVRTIAGRAGHAGSKDGPGADALFEGPSGITGQGGNLYVVDTIAQTIREIQLTPSSTDE